MSVADHAGEGACIVSQEQDWRRIFRGADAPARAFRNYLSVAIGHDKGGTW